MEQRLIKELLLKYNNEITNKITIKKMNNDTNLVFTLLEVQKFSEVLINKILEEYNSYLNFEYAQFGLDEQDINQFKKFCL
jgi:hypothetical protein